MNKILHITSGDIAGAGLSKSGLAGEVFVWHDVLYEGPRNPGWPDDRTLAARARFLEQTTGGGLKQSRILETLKDQYEKIAHANTYERIILWFDACLFDQSMLCHVLTCMPGQNRRKVRLLCVDAFPGIAPFHGLGQLRPSQLASVYDQRQDVTDEQYRYAQLVDSAFARQDTALFAQLSRDSAAPLPWVPAAVKRWLKEQPDPETGLGYLETKALEAIRKGCETPEEIFSAVSAADTPPQYWGDITLWAKINSLSDRQPPLVRIDGPLPHLPQWEGIADLKRFRITGSAD